MSRTTDPALLRFSASQQAVFWSRAHLLLLPWRREAISQHLLAAWAVYRLLTRPGRSIDFFSTDAESAGRFADRCARLCRALHVAIERSPAGLLPLGTLRIAVLRHESTLHFRLAAPPAIRGCRGDDLICTAFAGGEQTAAAIWKAAQAWTKAHPAGCCRIAAARPNYRRIKTLTLPTVPTV